MRKFEYQSVYYEKVIQLLLDTYRHELESAGPGHCLKITGLGSNEIMQLWTKLNAEFKNIDTFIISDHITDPNIFITPTKLIELRNQQNKPLLVLIPSNLRTAAEDSYGNATFKEISLDGIEDELLNKLKSSIPTDYQNIINNDIIGYIRKANKNTGDLIRYLISLEQLEYNDLNIGNLIYHLSLIPDSKLLEEKEKIRTRLNFNQISIDLLSQFELQTYDRIIELPLDANTIQNQIADFLKDELSLKNSFDLCESIYTRYTNLNFRYWIIPDLDPTKVKLYCEDFTSKNLKNENGFKIIKATDSKSVKVKIRYTTIPNPKEISELRFFKIKLMSVNGGGGDEMMTLRKVKNTDTNRPYREATVDLNPNQIEVGSYFFKVIAEDEHGNVINNDDDFKDLKIRKEFEDARKQDPNFPKSNFDYKLTCDSEDFDFIIEEAIDKPDNIKKNKVNNVLQAFFKYRIDQLKKKTELDIPVPSSDSNLWIADTRNKHTSQYHIYYSDLHNYQINLSSKLRVIEDLILANGRQFGMIKANLSSLQSQNGFENIQFFPSLLNDIVPKSIIDAREELFKRIIESNTNCDGIFETADIFNFINLVKVYCELFTNWTNEIKSKLAEDNIKQEDKEKLQEVFAQLQNLDLVKVKTKLSNGKSIDAILLSPLHPLRLSWNIQLHDVYSEWEATTNANSYYVNSWIEGLEDIFEGLIYPENNPLIFVEPSNYATYHYVNELCFGWGLYLNIINEASNEGMTSVTRQLTLYFRRLFNITKENFVENEVSFKLVYRHIKNYLVQHPYTEKLIINLINSGDADVFADVLIELEKEKIFTDTKYEIRIFKGNDTIIDHGEAFKMLLNPEYNISEEAEAFSQPSINRLFPKLRFSINLLDEYLVSPKKYNAHISFLISPFPIKVELIKPDELYRNIYFNGLLTDQTILVEEKDNNIKWNRYIKGNELIIKYNNTGTIGTTLFDNFQCFSSSTLASRYTESVPGTQLILNEKDKVLISHLHEYSDWVITFDKNLGPQIFDQPSKSNQIPFLLDYIPGEDISGISSYLTTKPTSEILGLLGPHFKEFNIDVHNPDDEIKIKLLLEDLRAVSSSLVLQLNSTKNKAFEVIGSAFTKRVLEKKGFLKEAFLVPIDLHQYLFENLQTESKSRADNLLVSINPDRKEIYINVIEIKCRTSLDATQTIELKEKILDQINNTIEALRYNFDPLYHHTFDRLDREIKNKEFKSLLSFYINRANRYEFLSENAYKTYIEFIQLLDAGYILVFNKIGVIFNFSATKKHEKEKVDSDLTYFTFGRGLIEEILDPDSDLNTKRLEDASFDDEMKEAIDSNSKLKPFIQQFKPKLSKEISPKTETEKLKNKAEIEEIIVTYNSDSKVTIKICEDDRTELDSKETTTCDPLNHSDWQNPPTFDIVIGKSSPSNQFGILGETYNHKKIAIDLTDTNTISLFGVQGGGKSYTIGTISEMVLKHFNNVNLLPSPLAGVIFHYSESMDYEPEYTSMIYANNKENELKVLKERYGAIPDKIEDVVLLTPKDKVSERKSEFPSIQVLPISFNSKELSVQDWLFLLGAVGNDSTYIKQLKALMKDNRNDLSLKSISESLELTDLLSNTQKALARQKLSFAREYINDSTFLKDSLAPGRLIIVDLRDEFIVKDEALGLFVIMLNIFSSVKNFNGVHFNKFIVFDEAHKYMGNKDLTENIVTAIREMRHKGVSIMIASQDPPSLPNEIIELSTILLLHKFNSPQWLKHIQKSITQFNELTPSDLSSLSQGEGFLWATKSTDKNISIKPIKINIRPRVTLHGGGTIQATGN
jgi:DNA phosphorothioation-dependent restriction protein DptH